MSGCTIQVLALSTAILFGTVIWCNETDQQYKVCPVGYTDFLPDSKYCYLDGGEKKYNWTKSRGKCQESKGDLATFDTVNSRIYFANQGFHGYWFGFYWMPTLGRPVAVNYPLFNSCFKNIRHNLEEKNDNCGELYVYARSRVSQIHYTGCHIRKKYLCQKLKNVSLQDN